MYTVQVYVHGRAAFHFSFWPRSNIGTDKSAAYSGAILRHMHSLYYHTQTQLVTFLKSLV